MDDFAEIYLILFCKQHISFLIKGSDEEFSLHHLPAPWDTA